MKNHPKGCECGTCEDKRNLRSDWANVGNDMRVTLSLLKGISPPTISVEEIPVNNHPFSVKARKLKAEGKTFLSYLFHMLYGMTKITLYSQTETNYSRF